MFSSTGTRIGTRVLPPTKPGNAAKPTSFASRLLGFALLFAALVAAHWPLLRLPYYWDEAGYYIPAAYDFFRRGALIPYSTLSNAHPPLPSIYLAGFWRLFGFSPLVTRTAMCLAAAAALSAIYRLALRFTANSPAAAAVTLLTALYPVWFVQSTLAHADLLAAAFTLWGLDHFFAGRTDLAARASGFSSKKPDSQPSLAPAVLCFALAALAKETAIVTPLALAAWELRLTLRPAARTPSRDPRSRPTAHLRTALLLTTPTLPLAAWYAYHRLRTGFTFGNPEFLRYNATSTLTLPRIALALMHRALHLTAHLNLFVPVLLTLGCLLLPRLPNQHALATPDRKRLLPYILVVILANWIGFSVLGGALLTRYLLPVYPLVLLLCVSAWIQRLRLNRWIGLAALSAAAFLLGLFLNPPYRFAPEDTLAYRDSILLQQQAIAQLLARYGSPTVLTAWPASDELTKPELGYVSQPLPVVPIDNFSYPQIQLALQKQTQEAGPDHRPYTVALLFSTKYDPPGLLLQLPGRLNEQQLDQRYFAFHQDLDPATIAWLLGGQLVWQQSRHGQWAALLHFDRPQLAGLTPLH